MHECLVADLNTRPATFFVFLAPLPFAGAAVISEFYLKCIRVSAQKCKAYDVSQARHGALGPGFLPAGQSAL